MIGNYWNSAYRNLMKRKKFSFINIFGLAIGMASALLMLTYVTFEFSFDKMHTKYAHIYRVQSTFHEGEVLTDYWATSSFGYASAMKENLAGIEDYTRIAYPSPTGADCEIWRTDITGESDSLCRSGLLPSF